MSTHPPENLRDSGWDNSLHHYLGSEGTADNLSMLEAEVSLQEVKCKYWTCKYESNSTNEMTQHISVKHAVDESFVHPNSSEDLECPECGKATPAALANI